MLILRLAIPVVLNQLFDYLAPENIDPEEIQVGLRVLVPFHGREKVGIIIEITSDTEIEIIKLKAAIKVLDEHPLLSLKDRELLHWLCHYYHYPVGYVFCNTLPSLLKKGEVAILKTESYYSLTELGHTVDVSLLKGVKQQLFMQKLQQSKAVNSGTLRSWDKSWNATKKSLLKKQWLKQEQRSFPSFDLKNNLKESELILNESQQQAVDSVSNALGKFSVFLLEGVTGSGKTEVYMQLMTQVLVQGQQIMVLLPEITLTPQLASRFQQRFSVPIVIFHSKLSDKQRLQSWLAMQTGKAFILLGTRSALFTPFKNMGLLILDEEHDSSFKQQDKLRFSARDVAVMRAKLCAIPILLGSATPSLVSLANVERKRYHKLELPQRAGNAKPPKLLILDIRNKRMQQGLSVILLAQIRKTLANNEQVLIFLNRRGFAPRLMCYGCGWVACCRQCEANLVIHQQHNQLRCHYCQSQYLLISTCPACQKHELNALGLGTERVEQLLKDIFPDKRIVRLDAETTRFQGRLAHYLTQINAGQVDIILGTQMLAKGHHFPEVTLVALLDVDSHLFSLDFRSHEKLAQLIIQVAGRAGRGNKLGKVVLQTRQPEHPLLVSLIRQGYQQFAKNALNERKVASLPPYSYQALLRVNAADEITPQDFFNALKPLTEKYNQMERILVLGAVAAPMAKREGLYRFQLLFQSDNRMILHDFLTQLISDINQLKEARKVQWSLDVDPIDLY